MNWNAFVNQMGNNQINNNQINNQVIDEASKFRYLKIIEDNVSKKEIIYWLYYADEYNYEQFINDEELKNKFKFVEVFHIAVNVNNIYLNKYLDIINLLPNLKVITITNMTVIESIKPVLSGVHNVNNYNWYIMRNYNNFNNNNFNNNNFNNNIVDLNLLPHLNQYISILIYGYNILNIQLLENCINLKYLYLNSNKIDDILSIAKLEKIETLNIKNNNIENITFIENLTSLRHIDFYNNNINNIIPFLNLVKNVNNIGYNMLDINLCKNNINITDELLIIINEVYQYQTIPITLCIYSYIYNKYTDHPTIKSFSLKEIINNKDICLNLLNDVVIDFNNTLPIWNGKCCITDTQHTFM